MIQKSYKTYILGNREGYAVKVRGKKAKKRRVGDAQRMMNRISRTIVEQSGLQFLEDGTRNKQTFLFQKLPIRYMIFLTCPLRETGNSRGVSFCPFKQTMKAGLIYTVIFKILYKISTIHSINCYKMFIPEAINKLSVV